MTASLAQLEAWNALTGEHYGSEAQSIFFYALARMRQPETVLELGTGLGHSALWMGLAAAENGRGRVWTVDDGRRWAQLCEYLGRLDPHDDRWSVIPAVREVVRGLEATQAGSEAVLHADLTRRIAAALGLAEHISFLAGSVPLANTVPVTAETYPFLADALERPIEILYADIDHSPLGVLGVLVKYLPLMAETASIFIDSAATHLPSHLVLERTVEQLDRGKLPAIFRAGTTGPQYDRLEELASTRKFTYMPLPERRERRQNGLAWVQIEPVNVVPYPLTQTRGLFPSPLSGNAVEALFERGEPPEHDVGG